MLDEIVEETIVNPEVDDMVQEASVEVLRAIDDKQRKKELDEVRFFFKKT